MGTSYEQLEPAHQRFIEKQPIFFSGTAARESMINVSPKGMDALRVLSPNRIVWRNLTGSGNETATHLEDSPRMTIMWCAFEGPPMILRAYGLARAVHRDHADWDTLDAHFTPDMAVRQIFDVDVTMVLKSCGYGVPEMTLKQERDTLVKWAENKGEDGIRNYWVTRNTETLDGDPTYFADRS